MGAAWIAFYMQSSGWRSLRSASKAQTVAFALIEPPSFAHEPVMAWHRQVRGADWATPADVKRAIRSASILKDGRVVFNIAGNKYRIVVWIQGRRCPTQMPICAQRSPIPWPSRYYGRRQDMVT